MATHVIRGQHLRALDGVRGLAVLAVVAHHLNHRPFSAGYLGVDLFFVLSGFLITSLLVEEHQSEGRIALGRFYARRAKRLFPALVVGIVLTALTIIFLGHSYPVVRAFTNLGYVREAMFATIFYFQNWIHTPSLTPMSHTWSLAVEEQFYVVWPLVMTLLMGVAMRMRMIVTAVLSLVGLSLFTLLNFTSDPNAPYTATYSRGGELLAGALLAFTLQSRSGREWFAARAKWMAPSALGIFLVMCQTTQIGTIVRVPPSWMYRYGFAIVTVAAVALIATSVTAPHTVVGRIFSWRPLVGLGVISYGLYVYHWGVFYYLKPDFVHLPWYVVNLIGIAVALGLSLLSFRYIESPLRHMSYRGLKITLAPIGLALAIGATLIATTPSIATPFSTNPPTAPVVAVDGRIPGRADVVGSLDVLRGRPVHSIQFIGDVAMDRLALPMITAYAQMPSLTIYDDADSAWGITSSAGVPRTPEMQRGNVNLAALGAKVRAADVVIISSTLGDFATARVDISRYRAGLSRLVSLIQGFPHRPGIILVQGASPTLAGKSSDRLATLRINRVMRDLEVQFRGSVMVVGASAISNGSSISPVFGAPNNRPDAPTSQWVRWRAPDGIAVCQPAVVRQVTVILDVLQPFVGGRPARSWWNGEWVNSPIFRGPSPCVSDHP